MKSTHSQDRNVLHTKNNFYNNLSPFCFFFCCLNTQVRNIPGHSPLFLYAAVLLPSTPKSSIRTYSRTNKVVTRPLEPLLSSPLVLLRYQQASQITYTSVFSPRSQYVLILPLPWKNTKINMFINGEEAGTGGRERRSDIL